MEPDLNSKLSKYFEITAKALRKVNVSGSLGKEGRKSAEDLLDLSKRYYEDAKFFERKKDFVNAFGAVVYSHAFLDIGARIGLFDVDDDQLFMTDKKSPTTKNDFL